MAGYGYLPISIHARWNCLPVSYYEYFIGILWRSLKQLKYVYYPFEKRNTCSFWNTQGLPNQLVEKNNDVLCTLKLHPSFMLHISIILYLHLLTILPPSTCSTLPDPKLLSSWCSWRRAHGPAAGVHCQGWLGSMIHRPSTAVPARASGSGCSGDMSHQMPSSTVLIA